MPMVLSSKETSRIGLGSSGEVGRACESFTPDRKRRVDYVS